MPIIVKVIILAIVQGITEFLPVSSSGHLVIFGDLLELDSPGLTLEVGLHVGTLASVLFYYRKRILEILQQLPKRNSDGQKLALQIIAATIPIYVIGFAFRHGIEKCGDKPLIVAGLLIANGLALSTLFLTKKSGGSIGMKQAILIGIAQVCAVLPGISRAGSTITAARHLGVKPEKAAEFSLLMFIPAISGSIAYSSLKLFSEGLGSVSGGALSGGILVSAVVGYFAIELLIRSLTADKFKWFGVYCIVAGVVGLLIL